MSKYNRPALTSWLKKCLLWVVFLTLVMMSITALHVCVMPSLAQEPSSTDQPQPIRKGEVQSSDDQQNAQEVAEQIDSAPGSFGDPAVHAMLDGRLEVFAVGSYGLKGNIYHKYQLAPNSGWSSWKELGGATSYGEVSVAPNEDGRLTVFVHGTDDAVYFTYQRYVNDPNSWMPWNPLGKPGGIGLATSFGAPVAIRNGTGRIEVFAQTNVIDQSGRTYYLLNRQAQTAPNNGWGSSWSVVDISDFNGYEYHNLDAALDNQDRISIFTLNGYLRQTAIGSAIYDGLFSHGMSLRRIAAERNGDGNIGVVGVDFSFRLWATEQDRFGSLIGWLHMRNGQTPGCKPALALNAFNTLMAFVHGADTGHRTYWTQQGYEGLWEPWRSLGGQQAIGASPAAAMNDDGRMEVFVLGIDGQIYHAYEQSYPGGQWTIFHRL